MTLDFTWYLLIGFCPHTKRLVGYAPANLQEEIGSNASAEAATTRAPDDSQDAAQTEGEETVDGSKVPLGKHYMVFMAQTWTSKAKKYCFMAARC